MHTPYRSPELTFAEVKREFAENEGLVLNGHVDHPDVVKVLRDQHVVGVLRWTDNPGVSYRGRTCLGDKGPNIGRVLERYGVEVVDGKPGEVPF